MSREIKFNFYNKRTGVYTKWDDSNAGMSMSSFITHEYLEFLQYTGLKDKNGVEIFEGHIVKVNLVDGEEIFKVLFDEFNSRFCFEEFHGSRWGFTRANEIEVIGNIYEHPHLLEG